MKILRSTPVLITTNQKGYAIPILLTFMVLFSILFLGYIKNQKQQLSKNNETVNLYLCHKARNTYEAKIIKEVLNLNQSISLINGALALSAVLKPEVYLYLKRLKKLLQYAQEAHRISYMKNMMRLTLKGCLFFPITSNIPFNSPFRGSLKLKRSFSGLAILRRRKWKSYTISLSRKDAIKVTSQIEDNSVKQSSKRAITSLRLLF